MPETVDHPVYSGFALSQRERLRRGRNYGKFNLERFERLQGSSHYLGKGDIGDVEVACKFLFKESRWGVLTPDRNPGGILYLDLVFTEPGGCRLRDATVVLTLNEEDDSLGHHHVHVHPTAKIPVHITHHGPQNLHGQLDRAFKTTRHFFKPELDAGGFAGLGGVGRESEKHSVHQSQWKFSSVTMPNKSGKPTILKWHLVESELDQQSRHDNTFHTAFAFEHDGQPFFMQVGVSGHLDGKASHLRHKTKQGLKKLKFPVEEQFATVVNFGGRNNSYKTPLDELANTIPQDMVEKNMKLVPQVPRQPSNRGPHYELIEEEDSAIEQDGNSNDQPLPPQITNIPSPAVIEELQEIREKAVALLSSGQPAMAQQRPVQVAETLSALNGHVPEDSSIRFPTHDNSANSQSTSTTVVGQEQDEIIRGAAVNPGVDYEKVQQLLRETSLPAVIQLFILWIMSYRMKGSEVPSPSKKNASK
ncbi:hypothetical protein F4820DRAFT_405122 [Hypoxylon rubiginosum]|uniref:Uncharacterized protein n=1 Tax=Hypoxylon rubiginosum TaxID=110542 RepID=A0ACB9ZE58_9PEZI|nr:hypothetical protein F4820DRAFT_405122 [Hypoxylon rubiginosum]